MSSRAPWVAHFGFSTTPFRKTIPASQLCERASHQEAVARIRFCIAESLLGVLVPSAARDQLNGQAVAQSPAPEMPRQRRWSPTKPVLS